MQKNPTFKACSLRNSADAYRQFRSAGLFAGAHERAMVLLAHRASAVVIAGMGAAGVIATFIIYFVR